MAATAEEIIAAARLRIVSRRNPLLESVPEWVNDWHEDQKGAIKEIVEAYSRGVQLVVLDAPTGVGKTLIGESVRRMLEAKALYVCTTKSLQDQFVADFDYSKVIKGRANYATELYPHRFTPERSWDDMHISCEDCSGDNSCQWCTNKSSCPYEIAKIAARRADVAVLNTSYFLSEVNRPTREDKKPSFTDWPLVIFDEADLLEGELMSHVSVEVGRRRMEKYGLKEPKVTVEEDWARWIDESVPVLLDALGFARGREDIRSQREVRSLERLVGRLRLVRDGIGGEGKTPWVYTGRDGHVAFKPTVVNQFGEGYIWRHSERFLLMSATVISAEEMVGSLGFDGEWTSVKLGSPFDVEKRKVVIRPVADLKSVKGSDGRRGVDPRQYERLVEGIRRICGEHGEDENILVHCVSYDLASRLYKDLSGIGRRIYTYRQAAERAGVVAVLDKERGVVVLAPSLDRGINLVGDRCRVQIIAKCPYPYLGDRQISARLYGTGRAGQVWYNVQTVRTIVQMCGRAVRNRDDWAVCYVLDASFKTNLFSKARGLFPRWWLDAVKWERP